MKKLKLKKGVKIGALAAENDALLNKVFIDLGYIEKLSTTSDPHFLILGRAGSGKTALISEIKNRSDHVAVLNPEELSMQYLHNSTILQKITSWNVNLDVFYKYLWRHVCILELIRMRYGSAEDVPSLISQIFPLTNLIKPSQIKTKEISIKYLENHGGDYWIKCDTHIKKITDELTSRLNADDEIGCHLNTPFLKIGGGGSLGSESSVEKRVESEVIQRAQTIVQDYLVADLNKVVEMLEKYGFNDPKKKYHLVIDDLDTPWMRDDPLYINLIKSLLFTVNELSKRLQGVKIIVALRDNIYFRVFQKSDLHEPQREKWLDVQLTIQWEKQDLINLVNSRLSEVFRQEYTGVAPTLQDLLPAKTKKNNIDPIDFILERTFYRPRDVIDFINTCLEQSEWNAKLIWSDVWRAGMSYSDRRLQSVIDEWKDSYFGIHLVFNFLKKAKKSFSFNHFSDDDLNSILSHGEVEQSKWLKDLQECFIKGNMSLEEIKIEILKALYFIGVIGVKFPHTHKVVYSFHQLYGVGKDAFLEYPMHIHKMFWGGLGIDIEPNN